MSRVLPILFNTDMVRAILDGRKTVTRRIIKHDIDAILSSPYHKEHPDVEDKQIISKLCMPPYQPEDIMYVRETWQYAYELDGNDQIIEETGRYIYAADNPCPSNDWVMPDGTHRDCMPWRPSIHMPKEAARIWLKVTDVRVERLQEIDDAGAYDEGAGHADWIYQNGARRCEFMKLWNSTIKKSDIDRYGWDANPWVWVIEFERCEYLK